MPIVESIFKSGTDATPLDGAYDQYADGKAAKIWDIFVGDTEARAGNIKKFLVEVLQRHGCKRILDAAAGNG